MDTVSTAGAGLGNGDGRFGRLLRSELLQGSQISVRKLKMWIRSFASSYLKHVGHFDKYKVTFTIHIHVVLMERLSGKK